MVSKKYEILTRKKGTKRWFIRNEKSDRKTALKDVKELREISASRDFKVRKKK